MQMKILFAATAAAALIGISAASAQQNCVGGYWMMREIPLSCDNVGVPSGDGVTSGTAEEIRNGNRGFFASAPNAGSGNAEELQLGSNQAGGVVEEPMYTGSIGTGQSNGNAEELPGSAQWRFVNSREECQPGAHWMLELESGDRPVAC